ncbi:hypothetical protein C8Q76DRAFT_392635 [Earliella scabrosa]|nr:hypothetical protein C8Q76DRAFT_392635 [Earliella scabrosa]
MQRTAVSLYDRLYINQSSPPPFHEPLCRHFHFPESPVMICSEYTDTGSCRFGEHCRYEHMSEDELEELMNTGTWPEPHPNQSHALVDHIAEFFASYPDFAYDPSAPFIDEFFNLCEYRGWDVNSDERRAAQFHLQAAMISQFNNPEPGAARDLRTWQHLCAVLKIEPAPGSVRECRAIVTRVQVNICDLIRAPTEGKPCLFATEWELAAYSRRTKKIFPGEEIQAGSVLRFLLRHI